MPDPERSLRIGIVTDGLEEREEEGQVSIANGGVGVYIYSLVRQLRAVAPQHELVLIRCGTARLDVYRDPALRTVTLRRTPAGRLGRALDLPYRRVVREVGLDLLHYPNQFGGAFLPAGIKRVVTLHDITPLLFPRYHPWRSVAGYRLLLRRALRAADAVIVDSTATARDLIDRGLAPAEKITAVPLGVDERFNAQARPADFDTRYDLPPRFLLTVGVLEPRKNHATLVQVLARLQRRGLRIGLVIVGRDGWAWHDPLATASLTQLRPWVRLFRNVPDADLPAFYARAEAFVYPSFYEGFGLPILEAMACGTPVVASNVSSMPEVAGGAALLADPHRVDDIVEKLHALLADAELRRRLVAAGRVRAAELTWRRTAERTLAVYEQVGRNGG